MSIIYNTIIIILSHIFFYQINCLDTYALNSLILQEHNKYRAIHGVPDLQLDNKLMQFATQYAESLAKNSNDYYLVPSGNYYEGDQKLGENLYQCNKKSCMDNYIQPLEIWYKEKEKYNFLTNVGEQGTSNFTQMVWKNTKKMGCGVGQKTDSIFKVVCYYLPKGNVAEKYTENVLQIQKKADNKIDNNENLENANKEYNNYEEFITDSSYNLKIYWYYVFLILILTI